MNQFVGQNTGLTLTKSGKNQRSIPPSYNLTKNINMEFRGMSSNIPQQKNSGSRGEYEYDIDITNNIKKMNNTNNLVGGTNGPSGGVPGCSSNPAAPNFTNLGESVGSNPSSVVGHYNTSGNNMVEGIDVCGTSGNQYGGGSSIVGVGTGNISVKKSMMKI